MLRKSIIIILVILPLFDLSLEAQNGQAIYYMNLPQNHLFNPALRPTNSFYLGLGLTGISANINNNFFNLSDFLIPGQADSIITILHPDYDVTEFLSKLKESNFLSPGLNVQLFGLGFNAGKDLYIFLDVIERVEGNISLPGDLIKLGLTGNEDFVGKTIDLTAMDAGLLYFREAGAGFSKQFGKNLRLGAKVKTLFGIAGMSLDNRQLGLTVNDDFTHTFNADLMANVSGPVTFYFDADHKPDSVYVDKDRIMSPGFFLNTKNMGLGLDLGALYNITPKLSVSAAFTDLGWIKWKEGVTNMKAGSEFSFSGFNIKDVVNGTKTFDELADEMLDSLKNSFVVTDDKAPFTTWLSPAFTMGAGYSLTKSFGVGLLLRTLIENKRLREAVTLSANLNLNNAFSASVTYTASNHRYDNLGAGIAFRAGFLQFYAVTDRIPVMWNKIISGGSQIPLPATWNTLNVRFGLNVALGNNIKKKADKPMLVITE